jgi:3',5'-cyclic AMP phosphodiesterase CpdA
LFGEGAVDPRPNWELNTKAHIQGISTTADRKPYLTIRRGPKLDYKSKQYQTPLKMNKNGKFKILQVADLHLATGNGKCRDPVPAESAKNCLADPRTLKFLNTMLDTEKPDMVVLTGDQIFGDNAPDAETAVFKALDPIIKRKIPYAVTMGNHDDEGSMTRQEIMSLSANMPYSVAAVGPEAVAGVGNYVVPVEGYSSHNTAITLYFLDTHKYSPNPKVNPGYDWIKESQLKWLEDEGASLQKSSAAYSKMHMSMAFFHIPLPEYRNLDGQTKVGELREGVTAPRYNTGARSVLGKLGVSVVSVGHDHCNDYCVLDIQDKDSSRENRMWLCYGGGSGEGGYGGYNGYIRRMRVYEINTNDGKIETWKRLESQTGKEIDRYTLVSEGNLA